jgi:hypothetical protein
LETQRHFKLRAPSKLLDDFCVPALFEEWQGARVPNKAPTPCDLVKNGVEKRGDFGDGRLTVLHGEQRSSSGPCSWIGVVDDIQQEEMTTTQIDMVVHLWLMVVVLTMLLALAAVCGVWLRQLFLELLTLLIVHF